MSDLNVDLDYFDHPKCARLVSLIGRDAEVLPLRLWCYVGKHHCVDGKLSGYSPQVIERIVRWQGQPGKCLEALTAVGFLDQEKDGTYKVHDWKEHQGHIHALKVRNKKVARNRWKRIKNEVVTVDTSGIPKNTSGVPYPTILAVPTYQPSTSTSKPKDKRIGDRAPFSPPGIDDVREFIRTNRYEVQADQWFAHYEANGWKVGRVPMRDWKATVRKWHFSEYGKGGLNGNKNGGGSGQRPGGSAPREDGSKFDGIGTVVEV